MSELGGMGVLPRFEPIQEQAEKVHKISKAGAVSAASVDIKNDDLYRAGALVTAGSNSY